MADTALEAYLAAITSGDGTAAAAVARDEMRAGSSAEEIIGNLLAPAQEHVGLGWQDARLTIALEHRASAITETVLESVVLWARQAGGLPDEGSLGRAAVLCAEGEWHTLPARMAAQVLRLRGVEVTFVGPSLPAREVPGLLGEHPPAVVAVACALPFNLMGGWRTVSAVRQVGALVICGGRGFGVGGRWAAAIGGDAWAVDFSTGADLVIAALAKPIELPRLPLGSEPAIVEVARLARLAGPLVEQAARQALGESRVDLVPDRILSATREDLAACLDAISSAVLVEDPRVVTEFVNWFETVIAARDLPLAFVTQAFAALESVLPAELPLARGMASTGRDACTQPLAWRGYRPA